MGWRGGGDGGGRSLDLTIEGFPEGRVPHGILRGELIRRARAIRVMADDVGMLHGGLCEKQRKAWEDDGREAWK